MRVMHQAVNNHFEGFEAYYQPIMDIKENRLASAETLMRFWTEETGAVSPVEFIPLLEESGLIIPVGKWILHQAMDACSKIRKTMPEFRISVNLSYIQVLKSNVLGEILSGMEKYDLDPGSIIIELTESGFWSRIIILWVFAKGYGKTGSCWRWTTSGRGILISIICIT